MPASQHAAVLPPNGVDLRLLPADLPGGVTKLSLYVTPFNGREELAKQLQPLAAHLTQVLGLPIDVSVAASYGSLVDDMVAKRVDIALFSPLSYVLAREKDPGIHLLARTLTLGAIDYASYIVVRSDDKAETLRDLKGRTIALVDEMSTAGYLFPLAALRQAGMAPGLDIHTKFLGSHIKALHAVMAGQVDAAAISSGVLTLSRETWAGVPDLASVRILHHAGRIPYDALCARADLPRSGAQKLAWAFQGLNTSTRVGRAVLSHTEGMTGWIAAQDPDYDGIRRVLKQIRGQNAPHDDRLGAHDQ